MRPEVQLDESSLINIFSKVADAHQLARCSMVCKRWRSLCWSVPSLRFSYSAACMQDLWDDEHTISTVLRRAHNQSPACLKHLQVRFTCYYFGPDLGAEDQKAAAHWLSRVDSLTTLTLKFPSGGWGPAVWSYILASQENLESLKITGEFYSDIYSPGWSLPALKTLKLGNAVHVKTKLLEDLLAACPVLETLHVTNIIIDSSMRISSATLRSLHISAHKKGFEDRANLILQTVPSLTSLYFAGFGFRTPAVNARQSMEKVTSLTLDSACQLDQDFVNVERLTLIGQWNEHEDFPSIFKRTPRMTRLDLKEFPTGGITCDLPVNQLKDLHVDSSSFCVRVLPFHLFIAEPCLPQAIVDDSRLELVEGTTLHYRVDKRLYLDVEELKPLFASRKIPMLVVEYNRANAVDPKSPECKVLHDLFDLQLLYPDQISFSH